MLAHLDNDGFDEDSNGIGGDGDGDDDDDDVDDDVSPEKVLGT